MQEEENIQRWASRSELRRDLEEMRKRQEPFFIFFRDCCGHCREKGFVENILDGVTKVSIDAESIGYRTDIKLERQSQPPIWIDVSDGTIPTRERLEFCNRHSIDLFELARESETTNLVVTKSRIPRRQCGAKGRKRLKELWELLSTTDDAKVGIIEDFRTEKQKERDWNDFREETKQSRALAEKGCSRCKRSLMDESGGYGYAAIKVHRVDGNCQNAVALCMQCEFEIRGGWNGEYPEDAEKWMLSDECEACIQIYTSQLENLEEIQKVDRRHLLMPTHYGSRMVHEPRSKQQRYTVAETTVNRQELLCILAMIKFVATWPPVNTHPNMKMFRHEVEK